MLTEWRGSLHSECSSHTNTHIDREKKGKSLAGGALNL